MPSQVLQRMLGIRLPLVGAPMAGPGGGRLAAAVSAAGGLGMIGVGAGRDGAWIRAQAALAEAAGAPYGVGLMAWAQATNPAQLETVLELHPALVSVSFGDLDDAVGRLRAAGIRTATQVGDLADLARAEDAGVDLVVARGREAGGHGRDSHRLAELLSSVLANTGLPALAAGGIATPTDVRRVLAAGAVGVWVGTAFLGSPEADNTEAARRRLFAARETGYARVFDVAQQAAWPREYGGRAVRNQFFDHWVGREDQMTATAREAFARAVAEGDYDVAHLYAGAGVDQLVRERPVAEVVAALFPG